MITERAFNFAYDFSRYFKEFRNHFCENAGENLTWVHSNSAIWVVPVWQAHSDVKIQADIHRFDCTDQICFWASLNLKLRMSVTKTSRTL